MHTLMNEPFVLRIKDLWCMVLEKYKNDHDKKNAFLNLCRSSDRQ